MPLDGSEFQWDEATKLDAAVTRLLIEGRERIERGWCQGFLRMCGEVCMVGALGYPGGGMFAAAVRRLEQAAGIPPDSNLPHWNDRPERTKAEVLAVYDIAIAGV